MSSLQYFDAQQFLPNSFHFYKAIAQFIVIMHTPLMK